MPHEFTVNASDNATVEVRLTGYLGDDALDDLQAWVKKTNEVSKKLLKDSGGRINCLADLSFVDGYSIAAFNIIRGLAEEGKGRMRKIATFGAGKFMNLAQEVMTTLTGMHSIKAFQTRSEALEWLRAEEEEY